MQDQPPVLEWKVCDGEALDDPAWEAFLAWPDEQAGAAWPQRRYVLATPALLVVLLCWWVGWPASADPPRVERTTPETIQVSSPLETIYFRFYFHPRDAQAVQVVAAQLDRQYERLRQDFALGPLSLDTKVTIKVGYPITSATQLFNPAFDSSTLVVPATFLPQPGTSGREVALARYTENWLAGRALDEANRQANVRPQWQPTLDGLRFVFWLRQRKDYVLRSESVYIALQRSLPAATAWMSAPKALRGDDTTYLDQRIYTEPEALTRDFAVTTTFTDYLLTTYGRQRLPDLLDGFGRYDTWEELSPAVFGVTASELEAGWHAYLEKSSDWSKEAVNGFPRAD